MDASSDMDVENVEAGLCLDESASSEAKDEKITLPCPARFDSIQTVEAHGLTGDTLFLEGCSVVGNIMAKIAFAWKRLATHVVVMDVETGRQMQAEEKATRPVVQFIIINESDAASCVESHCLNLQLHALLEDSVACEQIFDMLLRNGRDGSTVLADIASVRECNWRTAAMTLARLGVAYGPAFAEAARYGHVEVVEFLLSVEATLLAEGGLKSQLSGISLPQQIFRNDNTALILAAKKGHFKVVKELLDAGSSIHHQGEVGRTALILAAKKGHFKVVKELLDAGSAIEHQDKLGRTALIWAAEFGHIEVVKTFLAAGSAIEHQDEEGRTALIFAADEGHLEVVKALLAAGSTIDREKKNGATALILAANRGNFMIVKELVAAGFSVDHQDKNGRTALIFATANAHLKIVKALLNAGSDINHQDGEGGSPLLWAAGYGHLEVVKALLAAGSALNHQDKLGLTAQIVAAENGHVIVTEVLLAAGSAQMQARINRNFETDLRNKRVTETEISA